MDNKEKLEFIRNLDVINLYHLNKSSFPPEIVDAFEKNYNTLYYLFKVAMPVFGDLPDKVRELMMKQFPAFKKETRPLLVKEIDSLVTSVGVDLIMGLAGLLKAKGEGKTTREIYEPFDEWVKKNTYPEDTWEEVQDNERMDFGASDYPVAKWKKIKEKENIFRQLEMEWIKQRRFEFIDLLQTTLLTYFEGFELLEADALIVYSIILRNEYEDYNEVCENIEDFIDWGLPEEDFALDLSELWKKQIALGNEKRWQVADLRYRRVYGEEV